MFERKVTKDLHLLTAGKNYFEPPPSSTTSTSSPHFPLIATSSHNPISSFFNTISNDRALILVSIITTFKSYSIQVFRVRRPCKSVNSPAQRYKGIPYTLVLTLPSDANPWNVKMILIGAVGTMIIVGLVCLLYKFCGVKLLKRLGLNDDKHVLFTEIKEKGKTIYTSINFRLLLSEC